MRLVDPVQALGFRRLGGKINDFRHRTLHTKREFVRRDASRQGSVTRILNSAQAIELLNQLFANRLFLCRKCPFRSAKVERILRVNAQRNGIVSRPQVVPVTFVPVFTRSDRNKLR